MPPRGQRDLRRWRIRADSRKRAWQPGRDAADDQPAAAEILYSRHGDYRHLQKHVQLAKNTGVVEQALLLEDGDVLEVDADTAVKAGK